jgi:WW domain
MTKPMVQTIIIYLYQSTSASTIDSPSASTTSDTTTDAAFPPGVEKQTTGDGKTYYIDHNTRTTSWDPPGSAAQPSRLQLPEHLHCPKTVFLAELYRSACNRSLPGLAGLALREIEACSALPDSPTTGDAPPPDEDSTVNAGGQEEADDFPQMHEIAESLKIALYGSFIARDQRSERRATLRRALMEVHASVIVEVLLTSTTAAGADGGQLEGASNTDEIDTGLPLAQWCADDDDFAGDLLRYIGLHVFHLHAASGGGDLNEVD